MAGGNMDTDSRVRLMSPRTRNQGRRSDILSSTPCVLSGLQITSSQNQIKTSDAPSGQTNQESTTITRQCTKWHKRNLRAKSQSQTIQIINRQHEMPNNEKPLQKIQHHCKTGNEDTQKDEKNAKQPHTAGKKKTAKASSKDPPRETHTNVNTIH